MNLTIVGAGPAGLAAAIALRQAGFNALVIDRSRPPFDKACGEGLLPDAVAVLSKLGISIPPGLGYRFDGISFLDEKSAVSAKFREGQGIGIRRTVLHSLLLERALHLGVECRWGISTRAIDPCDFTIAADGQNSSFRRQAGLDAQSGTSLRFGFRRHFRVAPWSSHVELYWGRHFQIYLTPVAHDEVCIALISQDKTFRLARALAETPRLQKHLAGAMPTTVELGSVSASRRLHRLNQGKTILVGDASGSVDAITGQGMCLSFKQALALPDALKSGNLREYARAHARIRRLPAFMSELMLTLDRHPALQTASLSALAKFPAVFSALVGLHVGNLPAVGRRHRRPSAQIDYGSI